MFSPSRWNQREIAALVVLLVVAAGVRLPGLFSRTIWYDEAITLLETAGHASPVWPSEPVAASVAKQYFEGWPRLSEVSEGLRRTDIHPPVYYWGLTLWRQWLGFSLETARAFSLLCSVGAVLVLYWLLQTANIEYAFVLTLVYALSTGAVLYGQIARAYALAALLMLMGALFAYLASDFAPRDRTRAGIYAVAMSVCCGVALQTNYLTLFPVGVILVWFLWQLWPVWRIGAVAGLCIAAAIGMIGFSTLWTQTGMRPHQAASYAGLLVDVKAKVLMNLTLFWSPTFTSMRLHRPLPSQLLFYGVNGGLLVLMASSCAQLLRRWHELNQKFWILLSGLACAPSAGILLLDLLFEKNLSVNRYVAFAGPAVAVIMAYGITRLLVSRQRVGWALMVILWGVQLLGINWGAENQIDSRVHSVARAIEAASAHSQVVIIGAGHGRGHPGALLYELNPDITVAVLTNSHNPESLLPRVQDYEDIWISFASDRATQRVEQDLLNRLQQSGQYQELWRNERTIQLRKVDKR